MSTVGCEVMTAAVGQSAPPIAVVLFDAAPVAEIEPKKGSPSVFLVLGESAHVKVPVRIDFGASARFLVHVEGTVVKAAVAVEGNA